MGRENVMEVKFYDTVNDELLKFAVIISQSNGKWVFCKHKERDTYEVPGGHREAGEDIFETAKRELQEETGAIKFEIKPICVYSVTGKTNVTVIYKGEEIGTFPWSVALGYCSIESENPSLTVMINDDGTLKVDYSDDDDYYTFHCVKSDSE